MRYSREDALKKIRQFLVAQTKPDETTCEAAARLGIFCRGYDQWSREQLAAMYPWLAKRAGPDASREELLRLVIAWDGARQLVHKTSTTCDAHMIDHESCLGFDRFSNAQLLKMFPQLFQPDDEITDW